MKAFSFPLIALTCFFLLFSVLLAYDKLQSRLLQETLQADAERIVSEMPLEAKVGQILHAGIRGKSWNSRIAKMLRLYKVGGVILFKYNFGSIRSIQKLNLKLQKGSIRSSQIPLLISTDQEGGRVRRIGPKGTTPFPGAMAFGQAGRIDYTRDASFTTAYELLRIGINWILAPVLDVNNNPNNPVINVRSFGSDPRLVTAMGKAYLEGNRKAFSLSVIKHFPGHGDTDTDSHLSLPQINKSLVEMEKVELLPFRKAISETKAEALMTAHIVFSSLDPKKPATLSPRILKELLRKKLGFQGVIITDAMEMKAVVNQYSPVQAARLAFQAGADIILMTGSGNTIHKIYHSFLQDFRNGKLSEKELNQSVLRQISLKHKRGLFQKWKSNYYRPKPILEKYFQKQKEIAKSYYLEIHKKYGKKEGDLNTLISRSAVRSLRRPFLGISERDQKKIHFLLKSRVMIRQAVKKGVARKNIHKFHSYSQALAILTKHSKKHIWAIEISSSKKGIEFWNRLVISSHNLMLSQNSTSTPVKNSLSQARLIGLYAGNPFLKIHLPKRGAVLASFSPTPASKQALIYQVIQAGKMIPKANLILPDMNPRNKKKSLTPSSNDSEDPTHPKRFQ